jgi:aminoglycoside phosphotransferase (APT) family kinase protein
MRFLAPDRYPVWKQLLLDGIAQPGIAAQVGAIIAQLHAASAGDAEVERRFATDAIFHAIRLEPYLLATAFVHSDLAPRLRALAERTAATRLALVHGDVSPKNILLGPQGPVFLDAECAWYGDPAFDAAFCLNHFLLKCVARPRSTDDYLDCFDAFAAAYQAGITWEPRAAIESRIASLLPALFLARSTANRRSNTLRRNATGGWCAKRRARWSPILRNKSRMCCRIGATRSSRRDDENAITLRRSRDETPNDQG